ncbi:uncharacterized protein BO87DRAFT_412572 [Aspergillus neoniger CBS 115656]|uniref:FAD-binding domain-containing protein n=1 Tax=Aspergillus neoniger (strain CBS 115656) TaxID=1448310 RepID=A0A318ZSV8_ASPNB|nr:hypothetical protein BO87DRAFT_412572 [Aspergillus neoniger CBS 115656]PYH38772.1 hypothetical protein BO87DRAFT_412572 [Aspergillus neoniger CBS 115656]
MVHDWELPHLDGSTGMDASCLEGLQRYLDECPDLQPNSARAISGPTIASMPTPMLGTFDPMIDPSLGASAPAQAADSHVVNHQLSEEIDFQSILPAHPEPSDYKIVNFSPYKVHQRLAKKMRVGRFLLAADAAHLCNPFGGLGLTGGIVDVGGLLDCLAGIYSGQADEDILDIYDSVRRSKYNTIVNPTSSGNIRLLFEQNPETALQDSDLLRACKAAETDPAVTEKLAKAAERLQYDFTQHYRT